MTTVSDRLEPGAEEALRDLVQQARSKNSQRIIEMLGTTTTDDTKENTDGSA